MNNINQYIIEKLKVNSKTKISGYSGQLSKEKEEQIIDELCKYFQDSRTYKGIHYDTGLEVLERFFNDLISDFLDYNQGDYEKLAELVNVDVNELAKYIEENNDELYKEIEGFVLK
jgi:hypothetical protein